MPAVRLLVIYGYKTSLHQPQRGGRGAALQATLLSFLTHETPIATPMLLSTVPVLARPSHERNSHAHAHVE